ncbi:hypothetical protein BJ166DRAFT_505313 [Pestalotiopsis sp. NC0098]|nr:hypothetical protein BJ166DRAFT_505313 [Pestalotiopsis sp. NC0098]
MGITIFVVKKTTLPTFQTDLSSFLCFWHLPLVFIWLFFPQLAERGRERWGGGLSGILFDLVLDLFSRISMVETFVRKLQIGGGWEFSFYVMNLYVLRYQTLAAFAPM